MSVPRSIYQLKLQWRFAIIRQLFLVLSASMVLLVCTALLAANRSIPPDIGMGLVATSGCAKVDLLLSAELYRRPRVLAVVSALVAREEGDVPAFARSSRAAISGTPGHKP
jgi:hypothetical protein